MGDSAGGRGRRAAKLRVRGIVQGVGFRFYVAHRAAQRRVDGWVRNLADGSLEIWVEGGEAALEGFVEDVRAGPPGACIVRFEREEAEPAGQREGFKIVRNLG